MSAAEKRLCFCYGSATGNSESIAKRLHHDAVRSHGYSNAETMTLNDLVTKKVMEPQLASDGLSSLCLVIVCSTTGEGEPPENAMRFRRWLRNIKGTLHRTRFTVLALGDSNYNNFCSAGIFMDTKLAEGGAVRFYPRGEADDGIGLDLVVDPWLASIWSAIKATSEGTSAPVDSDAFSPSAALAATAGAGAENVPDSSGGGGDGRQVVVQREVIIVYSNASQICSTLALFLYERLIELGGEAKLCPIQYFTVPAECIETSNNHSNGHEGKSSNSRSGGGSSKVLVFILCTDSDERTLCAECARTKTRQSPPLGPFAKLFDSRRGAGGGSMDDMDTLTEPSASLRAWMADPSVLHYAAVCVSPKNESVPRAALLNERVKRVASLCHLQCLCNRHVSGEVRTIAVCAEDVYEWSESVLSAVPGITVDTNAIRMSMDWFFTDRVGAAFRDAYAADVLPAIEISYGGVLTSSGATAAAGGSSAGVDGLSGVSLAVERRCGSDVRTITSSPRRHHPMYRHSHHTPAHTDAGDGASTAVAPSTQRDNKVQIVGHLLTPLVFLYTGSSPFITSVAQEMYTRAGAHHLRASISDLSNFRHTGFPRRATFVFIVAGTLTKSMAKVLKSLRTLSSETKLSFDSVKFAILGIDESSSEKFNVCSLELETLLLSLRATKIHCTGLANMDHPEELHAVVQSWESNLWSAIMNPTASMAYLDSASPNIAPGKSFPKTGMDCFFSTSALYGGNSGGGAGVGSSALSGGRPFNSSAVASAVSVAAAAAAAASGLTSSVLGGAIGFTAKSTTATPPSPLLSASAAGTGSALTMASATEAAMTFPWDTIPLHRPQAHTTPIVLLYSSPGMSKTMATHTVAEAMRLGFSNVQVHSFSNFHHVDFVSYPNVILFCESGPDGRSSGGQRRFKHYLMSPSHLPDHFSHIRFGVLGLGPAPSNMVHSAFLWANMIARLQATSVFPVMVMPSMSLLHSLGMPWCECVLASMVALPHLRVHPAPIIAEEPLLQSSSSSPSAMPRDGAVLARMQERRKVLFLFGSVTDMTETIARELHREALERGYYSRVAALKYFEKMDFLSTETVAIVCGTANANPGGYPDNARKFARYVMRRDQSRNLLCDTNFAVLAVDNAVLYPDTFCHAATSIDARLSLLGGKRLCEMGKVDTSKSIAEPVEQWRKTFFTAMSEYYRATFTTNHSPFPITVSAVEGGMRTGRWPGQDAQQQLSIGHGGNTGSVDHFGPPLAVDRNLNRSLSSSVSRHSRSPAPAGSSAPASSTAAPPPVFKILIASAAPPQTAVPGIAACLTRTIRSETLFTPETRTINDLVKMNWRGAYAAVIFLLSSNDEDDFLADGGAFLRMLRQRSTPLDMFNNVFYTVLAVTDTNAGRFYVGRQLDRRLDELGGTRFYARGEAVDSIGIDRTVERWTTGLLTALETLYDTLLEKEGEDGMSSTRKAPLVRNVRADGDVVQDSLRDNAPLTSEVGALSPGWLETCSQTSSTLDRLAQSPASGASGDRVDGVLRSWRLLTSREVDCSVVHVDLSVPAGTRWTPGQTVAVLPTNDEALVHRILAYFCLRREEPFFPLSVVGEEASSYPSSPLYTNVEFPVSCGTVLSRYVSLRLPKGGGTTTICQLFTAAAHNEEHKNQVQAAVEEVFRCHGEGRFPMELADVLERLPPRLPISFRHVMEHLGVLQPRFYSISSSCMKDAQTLSLCVKVVPHGLCTGWLFNMCRWIDPAVCSGAFTPSKGELVNAKRRCAIPFVICSATEFRMPRDPLVPLVLVGPGTGIAPFRAFLQEREAMMMRMAQRNTRDAEGEAGGAGGSGAVAAGPIDLYFGCRRRSEDFLYEEELHSFEAAGALTSLAVAYSREAGSNGGSFWYGGCYVQDLLAECGVSLCEALLHDGARLFVCGDADSMAREVNETLVCLLQQHLCKGEATAREVVERLKKDGAYVQDVW